MIGTYIGNYRVVQRIGQGGMSEVYEAVHRSIRQRVAIKVLTPGLQLEEDALRRFFNEAVILSRLDHQGIVKIFDFGRLPSGAAYIMMERLRGETLQSRLCARLGRLPVSDALRITRQIAQALSAAHALSVIHRDVKPGNLFLVPDVAVAGGERVKLLDFGLAKLAGGQQGPTATLAGIVVGTPSYVSPEQCLGMEVTQKTDVYGLGVVLYRMLTGHLPFETDDDLEVIRLHMNEAPRSIRDHDPSLSEELAGLVEAMLMKAPRLRPSMAQVEWRLDALESQESQNGTIGSDLTASSLAAQLAEVKPPMPAASPEVAGGSAAAAARRGGRIVRTVATAVLLVGSLLLQLG